MKQWKILSAFVVMFLVAYFLPLSSSKVSGAILEAFKMLQWYARNHTLACVVPALFIAGGIITFLSKEARRQTSLRPTPWRPCREPSWQSALAACCRCSQVFIG